SARRQRFEERDRRTQRVVACPGRVDARTGHAVHQIEQPLDQAFALGRVGRKAQRVADALDDAGAWVACRIGVDAVEVDVARTAQRLAEPDEEVRVAVRNELSGEYLRAEI